MRIYLIILVITIWIPAISWAQYVEHDLCGMLDSETLYNLEKTVGQIELPWLASILYSPNINKNCMATLITKQYLVTLAQCLVNVSIQGVLFGSTQKSMNVGLNCTATKEKSCPIIREIDHPVIIHPDYAQPSKRNDIGLMRLNHPIFIWDAIRPICFPPADVSKKDFVAQHLLAAGFAERARRYTKLYVHIVDKEMCRMLYGGTEHYLCANTCDNGSKFISGSALMGVQVTDSKADYYYLIGMLVFVPEDCLDYKPDLFLRVDSYVEWIKSNVK